MEVMSNFDAKLRVFRGIRINRVIREIIIFFA